MHTKLSISIVAALALSAAATGVARAQTTKSDQASAPTNDEVDSAETGSPASTDYPKREISKHRTTNDEVNAAEKGAPASTEYGNREVSGKNSNAAWRELDKGVPASTEGDVIEEQPATGESKQGGGK